MEEDSAAAGSGGRRLDVRRLGRCGYAQSWALQQELVEQRIAERIPDTLILTEHEGVLTVGRGGSQSLASLGIPVFEVERGGEATWHGPGQIVAYPILALPPERRDVHRYLRDLEEVVIRVLAEVGIEAGRKPGWTGVWIGERKVCSIGVGFRRWVSFHGLALNLYNDPAAFAGFRPCGLEPDLMTRVADHAEIPRATILFEVLLIKHVLAVFGLELPPPPPPPPAVEARFPELPLLPS